jgi:hypothetical protein
MRAQPRMRNIWFFVGWILLAIGLVEVAAGMYEVFVPADASIRLEGLHANLWWGIVIAAAGLGYLLANRNRYIDM